MKQSMFFIGVIAVFTLLTQSCWRKIYSNNQQTNCTDIDYDPYKNDTSQILYESLLRTVAEQQIPDFSLIRDKNNILVIDKYFIRCAEQDTSDFRRLEKLSSIPSKIGNTRFRLKSKEDLKELADNEQKVIFALQVGYITINGDTAITGMQIIPFKPENSKRNVLAGGGTHYKFLKVQGRWVYVGTFCGEWVS